MKKTSRGNKGARPAAAPLDALIEEITVDAYGDRLGAFVRAVSAFENYIECTRAGID